MRKEHMRNKIKNIQTRSSNCPEGYTELKTEFEVRDALGGDVTGEYQEQLKELMSKKQWCSQSVYDEADMNTQMP